MDTESILISLGYIGIFLSVFIETGVPLGLVLPLPGWTLLLSAGVLSASGHLDVTLSIIVGILAATTGFIVGYFTGFTYGRKLFFETHKGRFFTAKQGRKTEKFMKKFGYLTLIIGRFFPIVHNLVPILSGIARTRFSAFMLANVIGAVIWVSSAVFAGYFIGRQIPNAPYYIIPLVILFMIFINTKYGRKKAQKFWDKLDIT